MQSDVIRKLLCGQGVITLSDACKELLENSLDAGATNIEVLVEDYGADCLQVSDNGRGIAAEDFDLICKSSCTSKLSSLEDLSRLSSFGFRGESLNLFSKNNVLTAYSSLTITTRGALEPVGHTLEFDHSGNIKKKVACARQVGTTVTCKNCFESFPVRRKQLLRNLKKEFSKLVDLTRSYALLPHDVSLSLVNVKNGKRTKEFSANCCNSVKENVWEVFGLPFFQTLVQLVQVPPTEDTLNDCKVQDKDLSYINKINGYVSSVHQGRASKDRQFLFVNNRPCELKLVSNALSSLQRYFPQLKVAGFCDVNCTPDKRTILIAKENLLEAIIRQSLLSAFEQTTVVSSCSKSNLANSDVQYSQTCQPKRSRLAGRFFSGCDIEIEQSASSESSAASSQNSETTNEVCQLGAGNTITNIMYGSKIFRRSSFAEMDIVGQFNLGFIITRFGDDLFIIDQHASDERYNYEVLQKTAIVESQRLVCSIPLEVSAYHREVIMQNLDQFVKNGFAIDFSDGIVMHRPAKLKDIFASKACRKSVMIGTAMRGDEMKRVNFNCPHGRPTVQHLAKLARRS
ncbi:mismatch repair endonuclease PMS2 [Trichuris trichiura]|uniref:Mismatch repair endonuclease PMS2 n=1 Tax=Trichuris trichiura TaxID=36087 RepID=A0A077Z6K9_TRITR|nr:mismatch repair endonuclease PMS2 [Trichuris trichiura]